VSFNPLQPIPPGVSDTTQINGAIAAVNGVLAGLMQSRTATCNTAITLTTSAQDVPNCSLTLTATGLNAFAQVVAVFDFGGDTEDGMVYIGQLIVDGALQTGEAHGDGAVGRATNAQVWQVQLSPGSHTLKLQAQRGGGTTDKEVMAAHTRIAAFLFDIP
jgi:hypothetical protein